MFILKNIFLLVQMNLVSLQHISSSGYNNPADSIVLLLKKISTSSCLQLSYTSNINNVLKHQFNPLLHTY